MGYYDLEIKKEIGVQRFFAYDYVPPCSQENCPICQTCPSRPTSEDENPRCGFVSNYLQAIYENIKDINPDLTAPQLFEVGMHLVPMYKQLALWLIAEASLDAEAVCRDVKRSAFIHFQVREIIKEITKTWTIVNLRPAYRPKGKERGESYEQRGDPNWVHAQGIKANPKVYDV